MEPRFYKWINMEKRAFVLRKDAPPDIVKEYEEYEDYMKRALVEGYERMRYCPYFRPEVADWDRAIKICSKCPHQFD